MEDTVQFVDPESFGGTRQFGFKEIVLNQLSRITSSGSKEWLGGYWQNKPIKLSGGVDGIVKVYIPDSREEYCNGVDVLHDLLHSRFDSKVRKELEDIDLLKWKDSNEKIVVKRKLFLSLCDFLFRINYLDAKESGE